MFPLGAIVLKIDKLLVSCAMLTTLSSKENTDNLKLLESFVLMCLSDVGEVGKTLPKEKIISLLEENYGFPSMPMAVLDKILGRIANSGKHFLEIDDSTTQNNKQFILRELPTNETVQFQVAEDRAKRDTNDVIESFIDYLPTSKLGGQLSREKIVEHLGNFFESNGYDILFEMDALRSATVNNTDKINYQIGRFILFSQENNADLFNKILSVAQGMMLASAIYIDTTVPRQVAQRRLADVEVFLDTTFLLYALGFKTPGQKQSADALLNLLRNNGAKLYVFSQHFVEIAEILNTFMNQNKYSYKKTQTLEGLVNLEPLEIKNEISGLEKSLNKIGVEIAPETQYTDGDGNLINGSKAHIDYNGLREKLIKKIPQYGKHRAMLDNDANAITAIMVKRAGLTYDAIESCPAIFVTTNYSLGRESNYFLGYKPNSRYIVPVMGDSDLTTILWLKYGMQTCKDISKLRLIELARAALMPTSNMLERFNAVAKRMVKRGILTQDEAANIRYNAYAQAEMVRLCDGDPALLGEKTLLSIRDNLKKKYVKEEIERANKAIAEKQESECRAHHAQKQADIASSNLNAIRNNINNRKTRLFDSADRNARSFANNISRIAQVILNILIFLFLLGVAYIVVISMPPFQTLSDSLYLLIAVVSAIVTFLPICKLSAGFRRLVYSWTFDFLYAKNIKKLQPKIDELDSLLEGGYEN